MWKGGTASLLSSIAVAKSKTRSQPGATAGRALDKVKLSFIYSIEVVKLPKTQ